MLKKLISMATATLVMAAGLGASAANATTDITQLSINVTSAPAPGMPTSNISINNISLNAEWGVGSITWTPSVSGSFATNTIYTARFTLTAVNTFVFNNISANGFSVSGAGSTGVTDSSTAVSAGANATTVVIDLTFPDTGSGQQQGPSQNNGCNSQGPTTTVSNVTDTGATIDFTDLAGCHVGTTTWNAVLRTGSTLVSQTNVAGSSPSITYTGLTAGTQYRVFFADPGMQSCPSTYCGYEMQTVFTTTGGNSAPSTPTVDAVAAAAKAAAEAAAAVAAAKTTLVSTLKAGKPITANDLNAADITVASSKAADRVNAKILALPEAKRADLSALQSIVRTENFVEKVSTPATQVSVTSHDLIQEGLLAADYKFKATVIRTLLSTDPAALSSIEKVEEAVKAAQAAVQARKDRLAAIVAKINGSK